MASSRQVHLLAVVAAVACLAPLASATQWMVGDGGGWRAKFNQTGWSEGKTFFVGDSLMFMYPKDTHTVAQVGKEAFAACNVENTIGIPMTSGNDVVQLDKPGKVWFICTKPNHCLNGMKLVIDVVPFPFPTIPFPLPRAPAPSPSQPALFTFPLPFAPAPSRRPLFPFPLPSAPAPSRRPLFPFPLPLTPAPSTDPESLVDAPSSAAVENPVGGGRRGRGGARF